MPGISLDSNLPLTVSSALRSRRPGKRGRWLVILGNGPSLADFDFSRFYEFDAIGMNAAYRYWDRVGWYPRYYICLDAVVGQSHREEIGRLILEPDRNDIELFVLRRDLIEQLSPSARNDSRVICFEHLLETSALFPQMPFTTGSHAALVGAWLGYKRMIMMGIDGSYVEKIPAAKDKGGSVLEIMETPDKNPNYFFPTYQIAGDKYTTPNPIPNLHLNCWRAVSEVLSTHKISIWNGSATSNVDTIPYRSFDDVEFENSLAQPAGGPLADDGAANMATGRLQHELATRKFDGSAEAAFPGENLVSVSLSGYLTWCGSFLRRRPVVGVAFALGLIMLVAAIAWLQAAPYRPALWVLLEALVFGWLLVTGLGYTGTLARKVDRKLRRQREAMIDALARSEKQADTIESRLTSAAATRAEAAVSTKLSELGEISQLAREAKKISDRVEAEVRGLTDKVDGVLRLAEAANAVAGRAEAAGKTLFSSASMYNFGRYRAFNRTLTDEQVETLKIWSRRLSVPTDNRTLGYAAHRICALESSMHGRLATTIEDIMLRSMVGQAISEKSVSVLEIGTLFGVGAIAVVDVLRREGKASHLTVIDPLESYYGRAKDIVTGQAVSEHAFRDNLRIAGIPGEDVTIIKGMSANAEVIEAAARRSYDLLIIDGDHSYAGVKGDFENYSPFVKLGGFVIFDDYGARDWPDVKRFVDEQMSDHPHFVLVGAEWRTVVFRAVQATVASPSEP